MAALLLVGCGSSDDELGPGGVSAGEAKSLEDAAEMLESPRLSEEAARPEEPDATPTGE